jgi:hypothetical protein
MSIPISEAEQTACLQCDLLMPARPPRRASEPPFRAGGQVPDEHLVGTRAHSDTARRRATNSVVRALRAVAARLPVTGSRRVRPDVQFVLDPRLSRRDATVIEVRDVIEL